jgi:hypothetical protein
MISQVHNFKGAPLAVLLGALFLAGCGGGGGSSSSGGGGGGGGGGTPGVGEIDASAASVDFGNVVIDATSSRTFTITNTGTASFPIGNTNPGAPFSVERPCDELAPNDSCTITVRFSPTEQGPFSASFDVGSQEINATINLSGQGDGLAVLIGSVTQSCPDPTVAVRVRVSDPSNVPVTGLDGSHFALTLGGADLDGFTTDSVSIDEPASVGIMIDWSNSLQAFRQDLIDGSTVFINSLRDVDRAGVFRFASAVDGNAEDFVLTDAAGKQQLVDGLNETFDGAQSPTFLWDALNDVLGRIDLEPNENRVVVHLTDGFDDGSTVTLDEVIALANDQNVTLFTIGFGNIEFEPLERLAGETGGQFFEADEDLSNLGVIYDTILGLLSNRYELTFTNPNPGTAATLQVVVTDDMARQGEDDREIPACP